MACINTADVRDQISFSGKSSCSKFSPNKFRPNFCGDCGQKIEGHKDGAVQDNEEIAIALEYSQGADLVPSEVFVHPGGGVLYLGGMKASTNVNFLSSNNIRVVVNTAQGLDSIWPKYAQGVEHRNKAIPGLSVLEMWWYDNDTQKLEPSLVHWAVREIDKALSQNRSVLVHCAMGRSRSSALVVAYLKCVSPELSVDDALATLQRSRRMAQPNPNFMNQLRSMKLSASVLEGVEGA